MELNGKGQAGSIFVFAMIALVVLLAVGVVSLQLAMQASHRAAVDAESAISFNLAEAGADAAEAWLRSQTLPPQGTQIDPLGGTVAAADGTYSAVIIPDAANPGAWAKSYDIIATGQATRHGVTQRVILRVQQQSFALYAYFTDQERSSVTNGTIWFYSNDRVYGPVHSNDQFHISWNTSATNPIFYDTVSSSATSVQWDPRAPSSSNDWKKVLQGAQGALTLKVDRIDLPQTTDDQKIAAWGDDTGFPTTNGVYLPAAGTQLNGGIYVRGDSTMTLSVAAGGKQQISITQTSPSRTTTVTVDPQTNTTTVADGQPGSPHTYTGIPCGAIYSTGNITSLSGTVADSVQDGTTILHRNAWTIATDVGAGKNITLTNNFKYNTLPDSTKPESDLSNL